ncbi:hypothetical protein [Xenorhabdus anantnagensis]|uniref:Transposase n=1 Tax=Xenorhabdus anantnagensis TaxID=3025875 RepID=A0ABT5LS80_9GAMM|nr:hypothetical protein [Xenorhabdus anantnagensis]MDC9597074.1 hypothetical protein [Xenorhabdus anantnagensis]
MFRDTGFTSHVFHCSASLSVGAARKQKGHAMRSLELVIRDQITLSVIKWCYP